LADPDRARQIGSQGRVEILKRHTYVHRMQSLLPRAFMVAPR